MTPPPEPPVDDLAPTPLEELLPDIAEEEKKSHEEGEEGKGGDGKKSGDGGGKKPAGEKKFEEDFFGEENLDEYDSETLIEKLKMLVWAPFSTMVPGASAFESEQDLKRKLFLGQLGLMTNQIDPQDIADPKLIERLEQRNQERQAQNRIEVAAAGSAAGLSGAVASLQEVPKDQQKKKQQQDVKLQTKQPLEASSYAREDAGEKRQDGEKSPSSQQQKTEVKLNPEAEEYSFAAEQDRATGNEPAAKEEGGFSVREVVEILEAGKPKNEAGAMDIDIGEKSTLASMTSIRDLFNITAQQTEFNQPEQRTDFKFADPAPKVDMGPMGAA